MNEFILKINNLPRRGYAILKINLFKILRFFGISFSFKIGKSGVDEKGNRYKEYTKEELFFIK
ncbi:MAG: hypothetical protein H0W75_05770 [Chitinophagaceae bacterium]|nr:hypothetical protein [Chitinophagaceae bacterium]